jgi:hypothetical protein
MAKFKVTWRVVESSSNSVSTIARGEKVKEAESAEALRTELTKVLTDHFGTMTGTTDRDFVIDIEAV